jgi:hypothetical protein
VKLAVETQSVRVAERSRSLPLLQLLRLERLDIRVAPHNHNIVAVFRGCQYGVVFVSDLLVVGAGVNVMVVSVNSKSTFENRVFAIAMNSNSCPASLCPSLSSDTLNKDGAFEHLVFLSLYRLDGSYSTIAPNVGDGKILVQNIMVRFEL